MGLLRLGGECGRRCGGHNTTRFAKPHQNVRFCLLSKTTVGRRREPAVAWFAAAESKTGSTTPRNFRFTSKSSPTVIRFTVREGLPTILSKPSSKGTRSSRISRTEAIQEQESRIRCQIRYEGASDMALSPSDCAHRDRLPRKRAASSCVVEPYNRH